MNERIKELTVNERIKKLTISAITKCFDDQLDRHGDLDRMYIPFEFSERFAKLIVEECIEVMSRNDYHGEWLGEKIKEHFGIE
jgi:hypothetical protein